MVRQRRVNGTVKGRGGVYASEPSTPHCFLIHSFSFASFSACDGSMKAIRILSNSQKAYSPELNHIFAFGKKNAFLKSTYFFYWRYGYSF